MRGIKRRKSEYKTKSSFAMDSDKDMQQTKSKFGDDNSKAISSQFSSYSKTRSPRKSVIK